MRYEHRDYRLVGEIERWPEQRPVERSPEQPADLQDGQRISAEASKPASDTLGEGGGQHPPPRIKPPGFALAAKHPTNYG